MPWQQVTPMSEKQEFISLAVREDANISRLCRYFRVSRKTAYKWLERFHLEGEAGLADRSRRPWRSPGQTPPVLEDAVLGVRGEHPAWGGRKIRARLQHLGWAAVPAASTITEILRRHGLLDSGESAKHKAWRRFEAKAPNELWQMDFKGHFAADQGRCHPLTVLDDHSRFALGLEACADERRETVCERLTAIFRRYGLPRTMLMDNGPPWGTEGQGDYSVLTVWLLRLGVQVGHSSPYHPQTLGKDERFHRTLEAELLQYCLGLELAVCQRRFEAWRQTYNLERPHEALELAPPVSRYRVSPRSFPETLPVWAYAPGDQVRKVQAQGWFSFRGREFRVSKAFRGQAVALRPTCRDGVWEVFFGPHCLAQIDERAAAEHD